MNLLVFAFIATSVKCQIFAQNQLFKFSERRKVCAVSPADRSFHVRSKAQCVEACQRIAKTLSPCVGVNFKRVSNTCEIYNKCPTSYNVNITGCRFIQKENGTNPSGCALACPAGYTYNAVVKSCYKLDLTLQMTRDDAEIVCKADNAHLVFIETLQEQLAINAVVGNIGTNNKYAWIGACLVANVLNRQFVWADSCKEYFGPAAGSQVKTMSYLNWYIITGGDYWCALNSYTANGKWDDHWCSCPDHYPLCEIEFE